ncbi:unnamed protein product [Schistosoma margrebowiei]|uniref:Uncharacterized protein n=1 Tax=Schistosoma margrebowiei TaxID=48269 RepID=A0A183N686_9TREM|nr:unnamed protein product [Schistosoma margrebowiei]
MLMRSLHMALCIGVDLARIPHSFPVQQKISFPNCFDYSDIDDLGGKLSQYWFSIDQSLSNKDSPNRVSDSDHLSTNIGSKIRTATGFQVRSRRSATSGLMRTGQSVSETATSVVNRTRVKRVECI